MSEGSVSNGNGNNPVVWKWISGLLATLIIGMWLTYLTLIKNIVTQEDLARQLAPMNEKTDVLIRKVDEQHDDIANIKTNVAVMNDKIPDMPTSKK